MKSRILIFLFAFLSIYIVFNRGSYEINMYRWDHSGYYLYLPAAFIYHDIGKLGFYPELNKQYSLTGSMDNYGIFDQPTGRRTDKYAIGTALFELPFFLAAHAYCVIAHIHPADGYSIPYQFGGIFCFIFWVSCGLFYLRAFLRAFFNDTITAITLLCIFLGTNLYCYTVFAPGMSHPFEFFLFSGVLYHTHLYYNTLLRKHVYWLGILLGLVIITRPVDIVVAIIPLLWQVYNGKGLRARLMLLKNNIKDVGIASFLFLAVAFIQMSYWKYTSGDWIHYSYEGEGFSFLHPHIIDGLFSYQKGWFLYTPIAFLGLFGFLFMRGECKKLIPSIMFSLVVMVYVVFSWRGWWYGGGFGSRPMIEALPLVAIPLAALSMQVFYVWKNILVKIVFSLTIVFFIALNMFQTFQYSKGTIHYVLMTKAYYWSIFGKVQASHEDWKLLKSDEEFQRQYDESLK